MQLAICWNIRVSRTTFPSELDGTVTMCRVRTISRKDSPIVGVSSETARQPSRVVRETKIQSELHGDVERPTEMIGPLGS